MSKKVFLAVLSVDNEALEGYTGALEHLFEKQVFGVARFEWGTRNPASQRGGYRRPFGRHHNDEDNEQNAFRLEIPRGLEVEVSLFIERFINSFSTAFDNLPRRLADETFTLAMFEAGLSENNNVVVDRIRVLQQVQFQETALGNGRMLNPGEELRQQEMDQRHQPQHRPAWARREHDYECLTIEGNSVLVSEELRAKVNHKAQALIPQLKAEKLAELAKPNSVAGKLVKKAANDAVNKPGKKDLSK